MIVFLRKKLLRQNQKESWAVLGGRDGTLESLAWAQRDSSTDRDVDR